MEMESDRLKQTYSKNSASHTARPDISKKHVSLKLLNRFLKCCPTDISREEAEVHQQEEQIKTP